MDREFLMINLRKAYEAGSSCVMFISKPSTETVKKAAEFGIATLKGFKLYEATEGFKYALKIGSEQATSVVSIIDTTYKRVKGGHGMWLMRFDKPHKGANYSHINVNRAITGSPDPHLYLPPGGLTVVKDTASFCKWLNNINTIAYSVCIATDVVFISMAAYKDYQQGSCENVVKTTGGIAGGWTGGYGGAVVGSTIGTFICPGVGTIALGFIGGIGGGIGGALGGSAVSQKLVNGEYDFSGLKHKLPNIAFFSKL